MGRPIVQRVRFVVSGRVIADFDMLPFYRMELIEILRWLLWRRMLLDPTAGPMLQAIFFGDYEPLIKLICEMAHKAGGIGAPRR